MHHIGGFDGSARPWHGGTAGAARAPCAHGKPISPLPRRALKPLPYPGKADPGPFQEPWEPRTGFYGSSAESFASLQEWPERFWPRWTSRRVLLEPFQTPRTGLPGFIIALRPPREGFQGLYGSSVESRRRFQGRPECFGPPSESGKVPLEALRGPRTRLPNPFAALGPSPQRSKGIYG